MERVVVAMSGGVDSAVCAALLKERGFEVIGITMQVWEQPQAARGCCGIASIEDARKVSFRLNIPHYVLNFRDTFKEKVIDNFCAEYLAGRTPNPCIRCNQYIKFDALLQKARQLGADYIATGHYARITFDSQSKKYLLKKGLDSQKDQSYVLYVLTQGQLKHTLTPLGELTKEKVRQIAKEKDLPVADKPESQEICFIPDNNYGRFVRKELNQDPRPGPIVNKEGRVIGEHQGIIHYTIGQRKGIGIADKQPLYVVSMSKKDNTIVVGEKRDVCSDELIADNVNLISMDKLAAPLRAEVTVRYRHPPAPATVSPLNRGRLNIKFDQPQWALTPGQSAVFYQGELVLGGGTIVE